MKNRRRRKIMEIISEKTIETQADLAGELKRAGFNVTQATVSRDIKDLRLAKVATGANRYRYAVPGEKKPENNWPQGWQVFKNTVTGLDLSENIIVVKTTPGAAQAVAVGIDNEGWPEIIGTVAGDDTILIVVKPKTSARKMMERFSSFLT
ncbi:MAG: arginine repressor [bacterium]|nr:arginine repressor [bacterium]